MSYQRLKPFKNNRSLLVPRSVYRSATPTLIGRSGRCYRWWRTGVSILVTVTTSQQRLHLPITDNYAATTTYRQLHLPAVTPPLPPQQPTTGEFSNSCLYRSTSA